MFGEQLDRWGCLWCNELLEIIEITAQDPPEEFPWKKLPEELRTQSIRSKLNDHWNIWDFWHAKGKARIQRLCFEATGRIDLFPCRKLFELGLDSVGWTMKELSEIQVGVEKELIRSGTIE